MVLQMSSGLNLYLTGGIADPNKYLEPRADENWSINDAAVCTFIKSKCSSTKLSVIEDCPTALSTWSTLQSHHQCQSTVSQIHLIQEAFLVQFSTSTPFSEMSE